jgi:hypothetical protein
MDFQDFNLHPTIRFLTTSRPYIQVVPPFPILAYEHTPQTKRKTLHFLVNIFGITREDIAEVGVIAVVKGVERQDVVFAGGRAEPGDEPGKYVFKNLQLDKPKDRGITPCFLRFFVRTCREYFPSPLAIASRDYITTKKNYLSLKKDEVVFLHEFYNEGFSLVENSQRVRGIVPTSLLKLRPFQNATVGGVKMLYSVDVPMPICTHKTDQSLDCDLMKLFPFKKTIKFNQLCFLMARYNQWATKPIESPLDVRMPEYNEWTIILHRLTNKSGSPQNVKSNNAANNSSNFSKNVLPIAENEAESTAMEEGKLMTEVTEESARSVLERWNQWVLLLRNNEDIRKLWNEKNIFLLKTSEAQDKMIQWNVPENSFLLKFGATWLATGKAGPIVVVQKIVKDGKATFNTMYFTYEAIARFGLGYLILNDNSESRNNRYWVDKEGRMINKWDDTRSPFKCKSNITEILTGYDTWVEAVTTADVTQKKRKVDAIDEGVSRPPCARRCEPQAEHWNYCPICGGALRHVEDDREANSRPNDSTNSSTHSQDSQDVALILSDFEKYVGLKEQPLASSQMSISSLTPISSWTPKSSPTISPTSTTSTTTSTTSDYSTLAYSNPSNMLHLSHTDLNSLSSDLKRHSKEITSQRTYISEYNTSLDRGHCYDPRQSQIQLPLKDLSGLKFGNLQISKLLGRGCFSQVYLGKYNYRGTNSIVAVKQQQRYKCLEGVLLSDFVQKERVLLGLLRHPCLVEVFGVEVIEGGQTLVIQELMASDLKTRLQSENKISPTQILKIIKNVALGLHHLHTARCSGPVVHLDLKWDNILCPRKEKDYYKIGDFGLSRIGRANGEMQRHLTSDYSTQTSWRYPRGWSAPEVVRNRQFGPPSDICTLGILLYVLFTGEDPTWRYDNYKTQTVHERLRLSDPTLNIPPKFLELISKCVEEDYIKRPTITEVLDELDQINWELQAYSIPLWEKIQRGILTDDVKQELRNLGETFLNQSVFTARKTNLFVSEWGTENVTLAHIAARQGHLHILQFLDSLTRELPKNLEFVAALHGRVNVLKWLHDIRYPLGVEMIKGAIIGGHSVAIADRLNIDIFQIPSYKLSLSLESLSSILPFLKEREDEEYWEHIEHFLDDNGVNAILNYSISSGNLKLAQFILERRGLTIEQYIQQYEPAENVYPLLIQAVFSNSVEMVKFLLSPKRTRPKLLSAKSSGSFMMNPFHACSLIPDDEFNIDILTTLLAYDEKKKYRNEAIGRGSPLFWAIKMNAVKVAKCLQENGAVSVSATYGPDWRDQARAWNSDIILNFGIQKNVPDHFGKQNAFEEVANLKPNSHSSTATSQRDEFKSKAKKNTLTMSFS